MWFRHRRGAAAAALGAVAVMLLPACSAEREESLVDADSLTIGVKEDQPGLGLDVNGELVGFDVDVANYIADHLGIEEDAAAGKETFVSLLGVERALLIGSCLLVMAMELMNSSMEAVIERYGAEHHELAGRAKDMGSAAVFVLMMNVILVWALILVPHYL